MRQAERPLMLGWRTVAALAFVFALVAGRHGSRVNAAPAQETTDLFAGLPWGPVANGVQLRLAPARAATERAERNGLYPLALQIRSVSDASLPYDAQLFSYALEYEIDGTWYAFERVDAVRNSSALQPASLRDLIATQTAIRPNIVRNEFLVLNLRDRSRHLALYEVGLNGPGRRLTLSAGTHVVRVRPGPAAFSSPRGGAVSNPITVTIPPFVVGSVPGASSSDSVRASLRQAFRFVDAPGDSRVLAQNALKQPWPVNLDNIPRLADFDTLQLLEPIERHYLALPRRLDAPNPSLPSSPATRFEFPVVAGDEGIASTLVELNPRGEAHFLNLTGQDAAAIVRALSSLAAMEQVRTGDYEPRLLELNRYRGSVPFTVLWLRSKSGRPDLFYYAKNGDARIKTRLEPEKLYSTDEFLKTARELGVTPLHNEAWAIAAGAVCARSVNTGRGPLLLNQAVAEIGLNDANDGVVWYVHFPEEPRDVIVSHPGASFTVEESTGKCTPSPAN